MHLRRNHVAGLIMAASLLSVARAGEIKWHNWPCEYQEASLCEVPVLLDAEVETRCSITAGLIKLQPVSAGVFEGCTDVRVQCNSNLTLTCSIIPTGVVAGDYSASLSRNDIDAPGGTAKLCVKLTDAIPAGQPGRRNVTVAHVRLTISPRP